MGFVYPGPHRQIVSKMWLNAPWTTRSESLCIIISFRAIKGFGRFTLYGRSKKPVSAFSGETLCQLAMAPQKDDYQSAALLIIVVFGVPNT